MTTTSTPKKAGTPRRRRGTAVFTNVLVALPIVLGVVALVWAYFGPLPESASQKAFLVRAGQPLPALEVADAAGRTSPLAALLPVGAPAAVLVMAPQCAHCHTQLQILELLRKEDPALLPRLVLISQGEEGETAEFRRRYPALDVYIDTKLALQRRYDLRGVPALLLIDAGGRVRESRVGLQSIDGLRPLLQQLRRPG